MTTKAKQKSQRAWIERNREAVRAYQREYQKAWRARNPERERAKVRAWQAANRETINEKARNRILVRVFGITRAQYAALLAEQNGKCAICASDKPGGQGRFHVDHDHSFESLDPRGRRGLLCHRCNTALGLFGDSADTLRAAIDYLEDHLTRLHRRAA